MGRSGYACKNVWGAKKESAEILLGIQRFVTTIILAEKDFRFLRKVDSMEIRKLENDEYRGIKYHTTYSSCGYYDIEFLGNGFSFVFREFPKPRVFDLSDTILSDWLDEPILFGAFEGEELLGFSEGFLEKWNARYRISNICVFQEGSRHRGTGSLLMERMLHEAEISGARMAVLETQSCNEHAIAFYRRNGFEVIGFDMYAYSNDDPERHEMRIEMGRKLI